MANNLEQHLIVNIVSRLPVESVLCCRCICKSWRVLLHEPYFTQMHTDRTLQQQQLLLDGGDDDDDPTTTTTEQHPASGPVSFLNLVFFPRMFGICDHFEVHLEDYYVKYADDYHKVSSRYHKNKIWSSGYKVSRPLIKPTPPLLRTGILILSPAAVRRSWLILGSCNGLICFYYEDSYIIYNPITNEYVNLQGATNDESRLINKSVDSRYLAYGFGYHPTTKDYKIVKIIYHRNNNVVPFDIYDYTDTSWRVQIYTLGTTGGKWRIKKQQDINENMCLPSFDTGNNRGVCVNGALYWITTVLPERRTIFNWAETHIISFDLADEKLKIIPSPPPRASTDVRYGLPLHFCNQLGVLERRLCMFQHAILSTDIWVMNYNNNCNGGNQYRWRKKFSIPLSNPCTHYEPIGLTKNGAVLCFRDNSYLNSYDPRTKCLESMGKVSLFDASFRISYTKSFVSLKALGEENAEIVKSFVATPANANRMKKITFLVKKTQQEQEQRRQQQQQQRKQYYYQT